jgi:hypothetical protein
MYDALTNLFIVKNVGQVMSLKNELCDTRMTKDDTISSYFVRISQLRDQLQAIDEAIPDKEIVTIALNGLPRSWDAFASSMNTRKEFPTFEELWTCCAQEESRITSKERIQKGEDAQAYATRFKKYGGKKKFGFQNKNSGRKPNPQGKRDMSKVQCFGCQTFGHYKRDCPNLTKKRKGKHHASTTNVNDEEPPKKSKHEETNFFYFSSLTGSIEDNDDMWLIDSGASRHMIVDRPFSTGGQLMCHEEMHRQMPCCRRLLVLQGSVWPSTYFCTWNFRTPAWVNNVIGLHESCLGQLPWDRFTGRVPFTGGFLSSGSSVGLFSLTDFP